MQGRLTQTSAGMLLGCLEVLMEDAVTSAGKAINSMRMDSLHGLRTTCLVPFEHPTLM